MVLHTALENRLVHTSLRDSAARTLRAWIVAGTIKPDQLYSIGEIALRLGTSPTPIREALLELASQGLVELMRNRGFRVQAISREDLNEIIEIRLMLEVPAMERLASIDDAIDFAETFDICERSEAAAKTGDIMSFLTLDRDFHLSMIAKLQNGRLLEEVGKYRDQTRLYGISHLDKAALANLTTEHRRILNAVVGRNVLDLKQVLRIHFGHILGDWAGR